MGARGVAGGGVNGGVGSVFGAMQAVPFQVLGNPHLVAGGGVIGVGAVFGTTQLVPFQEAGDVHLLAAEERDVVAFSLMRSSPASSELTPPASGSSPELGSWSMPADSPSGLTTAAVSVVVPDDSLSSESADLLEESSPPLTWSLLNDDSVIDADDP